MTTLDTPELTPLLATTADLDQRLTRRKDTVVPRALITRHPRPAIAVPPARLRHVPSLFPDSAQALPVHLVGKP